MEEEFLTRISLLQRVKDPTDHASWQEFVKCYGPLVHGWAVRQKLQNDDAEEATSRVLLRLYKYLPNFDYDPDRGRFRGYLSQTLKSVVAEMFRQWKRTPHTMDDSQGRFMLAIQTNPDAPDDLLSELVEEQRYHQWREAKKRAEARCDKEHVWQAWSLTREQQIPPREAADRLNIKLSTLYVHVARVNEYIREEFEKLD